MNSLSNAIEQAVQECYETGSACVRVDYNRLVIMAEWVTVDEFNAIEVYICVNGQTATSYIIEETKTEV